MELEGKATQPQAMAEFNYRKFAYFSHRLHHGITVNILV